MSIRGIAEDEIRATLQSGFSVAAHNGRWAREKLVDFNRTWAGRFYPQKRVRVAYVEEDGRLFTVTAIAYYGRWED